MAPDEALTRRLRTALAECSGITEKKMMGGICFLLNGNMISGVDRSRSGGGRFLFRVGKGNEAEALSRRGAYMMEQGGRRMGGFVFVDESDCDEEDLQEWVALARSYVGALPPK